MNTHPCPGCDTEFTPTMERPAYPMKVVRKRGHYHFGDDELMCRGCMERLWGSGTWILPSSGQIASWPSRDTYGHTSECEGCGVIIALPEDRRRKLTYCSDSCRQVIYRRRYAKPNTSSCVQCGDEFTARRGAKYCSDKCRQAAYRARA